MNLFIGFGTITPVNQLVIPFSWEERRPILLNSFFYVPPLFENHGDFPRLSWEDPSLFPLKQPVAIEYCSGNGAWICQKAKEIPGFNWVAVEKRFDRARKIWKRIQREKIANLLVVCSEALCFSTHYAPQGGISQVFVNFPDPWPKRKHAPNRLIQPPFLKTLVPLLEKKAKITLVSDDLPYILQMVRAFQALSCSFSPLLAPPHYTLEWPEEYGVSFFSDLWASKGKKAHYVVYERRFHGGS